MSSPTNSPPQSPQRKREGIPVGVFLVVLGVFGVVGLVGAGIWSLSGAIKLTDYPVNGQWQAQGKPWRIDFRPDKTIVSSTGPARAASSQDWTSQPGTYKIDYFGNLWVMLKDGRTYTASLVPPQGALAPVSLNRFDLIESGTEAVTVFERTVPLKSPAPGKPNS